MSDEPLVYPITGRVLIMLRKVLEYLGVMFLEFISTFGWIIKIWGEEIKVIGFFRPIAY
jgi:hypothetical protein